MDKYKEKYQFRYERDIDGKIYNREDNYISCCAGGKIYRYNEDTLIFTSPKRIRLVFKNEAGEIDRDYTPLVISTWDTPMEREITFKEENLEKQEELFKIRKKIKRELSEEKVEKLKLQLIKAQEVRKLKKVNNVANVSEKVKEITIEDIKEFYEELLEKEEDSKLINDILVED
jgi:alanyl-tRNA synthetase